MRTVTYGAACTADGFIAGRDGSYDWIRHSADAAAIMRDYWNTIDTLVMGRKTWDLVTAQDGGGGADAMARVHSYVFSRTLDAISRPGVTLVKTDPGAFVRELKAKPGKGICVFGGGDFARTLFAAGVVDEVGFNMHPVLLGSGVPLFLDPGRRVPLELVECRTLDTGCVYVLYRVTEA